MQIIHQNKLKKEQEIYQKLCTFTPTIDPISKELANKTSLSELHHNYRGKRIKDRIKLQVDNKESQECSFTPKIIQSQKSYKKYLKSIGKLTSPGTQHHSPLTWNEYDCPLMEQHDNYSPHAQGHERDRILYDDNLEIWRPLGSINMAEPDKMARDIKLKLQEKEMKRQQELMIKEINELKECTFQPKINDYPPSQHGPHHRTKPVIVKGLGRHLELRNLLNKQKELELKRKKEAFTVRNVDKYRSSIDGLTIVQVCPHLSHPLSSSSTL